MARCKINNVWTNSYEQSKLYEDLKKVYKSDLKALQKYIIIHTDSFQAWYGNTTAKEPTLKEVLAFALSPDDALAINEALRIFATSDDVRKYSDDIKEMVNKQYEIYNTRLATNTSLTPERKKRILEGLKKRKEALSEIDDIQNIQLFIESGYELLVASKVKMTEILSKGDLKSSEDRVELSQIGEYIKSFNLLDSVQGFTPSELAKINKVDVKALKAYQDALKEASTTLTAEEFADWVSKNKQPMTLVEKLAFVVAERKGLEKQYLNEGLRVSANYLYQFVEKGGVEEAKRNLQEHIDMINRTNLSDEVKAKRIAAITKSHNIVDEEFIYNELKNAYKDISLSSLWLDGAAQTESAVLQLIARATKFSVYSAEKRLLKFESELGEVYAEFVEGKSQNDVEKLNKDLVETYQEMIFNESGEMSTRLRLGFVTEYRDDLYKLAQHKFFKELGEKPTDKAKLKAYGAKIDKWFKENTQPKDPAIRKEIIAAKKKELTAAEYAIWEEDNMPEYKGVITYKRELAMPSKKYINPRYAAVKDNPWFKFITERYAELQELVPVQNRVGSMLPSVRKTDYDTLVEKGVGAATKEFITDTINFQATDNMYGLTGMDGKTYKAIPVYFTNYISPETTSMDLASSLMQFAKTAILFDEKNKIHSEISILTDIMDTVEFNPYNTNSKGEPIVNRFAKKLGMDGKNIKKEGQSNVSVLFNDFIDSAYYGMNKEKESMVILGQEVSKDKIIDKIILGSSILSLAGNVLQAFNNVTIGQVQNTMSALGGKDFSPEDYVKALGDTVKAEGHYMADFGKLKNKNLTTHLIEFFDPIQGKHLDAYGKEITGSVFKKMGLDAMFGLQNIGEIYVQVTPMFAMLRATKIKNDKGELVPAIEAYEVINNKLSIKSGYDWNNQKEFELREKLHAFNKRNQGVYNSFDRPMIQKYALGRAAIQFRKHIRPGFKRRYGSTYYDVSSGRLETGIYREFTRSLLRNFQNWYVSMKEGKESNREYSESEKAAIRQVVTEMGFFLGAVIVFTALLSVMAGGDDEDDFTSWASNFTIYQARRLQADIAFYIPVLGLNDTLRILQRPAVSLTLVERVVDTSWQLLGFNFQEWQWNAAEKYERKTGFSEKGDSKLGAKVRRLIPFYRNAENTTNPSEPLKFFNL